MKMNWVTPQWTYIRVRMSIWMWHNNKFQPIYTVSQLLLCPEWGGGPRYLEALCEIHHKSVVALWKILIRMVKWFAFLVAFGGPLIVKVWWCFHSSGVPGLPNFSHGLEGCTQVTLNLLSFLLFPFYFAYFNASIHQ